jgi:hypothetical protein
LTENEITEALLAVAFGLTSSSILLGLLIRSFWTRSTEHL